MSGGRDYPLTWFHRRDSLLLQSRERARKCRSTELKPSQSPVVNHNINCDKADCVCNSVIASPKNKHQNGQNQFSDRTFKPEMCFKSSKGPAPRVNYRNSWSFSEEFNVRADLPVKVMLTG